MSSALNPLSLSCLFPFLPESGLSQFSRYIKVVPYPRDGTFGMQMACKNKGLTVFPKYLLMSYTYTYINPVYILRTIYRTKPECLVPYPLKIRSPTHPLKSHVPVLFQMLDT